MTFATETAIIAVLVASVSTVCFGQTAPLSPSASQSVQQIIQQVHSSAPAPGAVLPSSIGIAPEGIAKLKLMPGCLINVHVFEETDLDGNYRLDSDGNISIPSIGTVALNSLSLRDAEEAIGLKLSSSGILNGPHVVVNLVDYAPQYVTVSGEVASPGRFPMLTPRTLRDVLGMAGETTNTAGDEIVIHRAGQVEPATETVHYRRNQTNSSALDATVNPGDSVLVKQAGIVYVLGAVVRPGGFLMQPDSSLNVVAALSLALGTTPEANIKEIRVLRKKEDGTWLVFHVPLNKIQKGHYAPIDLESLDIVYVPPSVLKETALDIKSVAGGVSQAAIYRLP